MRMELSLVGVAGCFFDWILTRVWKKLALYFLPLILAILTVGLTSAGHWINQNRLTERYLELANLEVDQWEKQWVPKPDSDEAESSPPATPPTQSKEIPASAEMLFRRVQQLQQNDARSMFFVALCYLQRGASSQGLNMLNRLAPNDRMGYPPAHAFLLEQMLAKPLTANEVPVVRHHAEGALLWEQISPQLLATISDLFGKLNVPEKVVEALSKAAARDKKYLLLLGQAAKAYPKYSVLGDESLEKASSYFTERLAKKPLDIKTRLMLADAKRLQSNMAAAEQTIVEGMKISDSPILKSALSELYCQVFAKTAEFKDGNWTGDIELLEKAFRLDPNNLHIFDEVARLARVSGNILNEELLAQLQENLASGSATSVTHMWMAEHCLNANEYAKAIPHLEQAVIRDPNAARCWNNLAYCLADVDSSRLEEALKDSDRAIALVPLMPDYHDTRGTILMKLKKPGDAIAAFERAIELIALTKGAIPPQPAYHERLAAAYAASGDKAMAETHTKFAAKLVVAAQEMARKAEEAKRAASPSNAVTPSAKPATGAEPAQTPPQADTKTDTPPQP